MGGRLVFLPYEFLISATSLYSRKSIIMNIIVLQYIREWWWFLVHSSEGALQLDKLSNAIIHLLHSFILCEAHTSLVGDVIHTTLSFCVLTTCATNLSTFHTNV
jgi:hypothetical protein